MYERENVILIETEKKKSKLEVTENNINGFDHYTLYIFLLFKFHAINYYYYFLLLLLKLRLTPCFASRLTLCFIWVKHLKTTFSLVFPCSFHFPFASITAESLLRLYMKMISFVSSQDCKSIEQL